MSDDSPVAILYDKDGNEVEVESFDGKYYLSTLMKQGVSTSAVNSSTTNLAAGATFTGTAQSTYGVAGIQVNMYADQPVRVCVEQSNDGSAWDIHDEWDLLAEQGDGRTIQATSEYFRVIAINLGASTTTELRLHSVLCPVVECLPRSLSKHGATKSARQTAGFVPDFSNFSTVDLRALVEDSDGNLSTRSGIFTDEASFRDDFTDGDVYVDVTGTCYFRNGSDHVIGSGTSFLSELIKTKYIKLSTDDDDKYIEIVDVLSDTDLLLMSPYDGSTGSGTGRTSWWIHRIGAGCSITQSGSEQILTIGTANGLVVGDGKKGDYLPFVLMIKAKISQRIANQQAAIGMMDTSSYVPEQQANLVFKGTDDTVVTLRTSFASTDVEETDVTLPFGGTTDDYNDFQIEVTGPRVVLWVNGMRLAEHHAHVPGPYDILDVAFGLWNTGITGSDTTLTLDYIYFTNFNRIEVALTPQGEPLSVQELRASIPNNTSVAAAAADTVLLDPNTARIGATIYNDSTSVMYMKLGTGASATSFTCKMAARSYYEIPYGYTGQINGYWATASGAARITELI